MKVRNLVAGIVLSVIGIFLWLWQPSSAWTLIQYAEIVDILHLIGGIFVAIGLGLLALGVIEAVVDITQKEKPKEPKH